MRAALLSKLRFPARVNAMLRLSPVVSVSKGRIAAGAVAVAAFAVSSTVYAIEVPSSILPPHSTANRALKSFSDFKQLFADNSTTREDGTRVMNREQFQRAVLDPGGKLSNEAIMRAKSRVFEVMGVPKSDPNITFGDFVVLMNLVSTPPADLSLSIRLFDEDQDDRITREEFMDVLASNSCSTIEFDKGCSFIRRIFGDHGMGMVSEKKLLRYVKELHDEMLAQEFRVCDNENHGYIMFTNFVKLMSAHTTLPNFILNVQADRRITQSEFVAFHDMLAHLDYAERAIAKFTRAGKRVNRNDFQRMMAAAPGVEVSDAVTDIVFSIFDTDNDGTLHHDSFLAVLKARQSRRIMKHRDMTVLQSFALSGVSAAIGATVVFPLDKIKTRLQTYPNATIRGIVKDMWREGARQLYRGLGPVLVGVIPEKAVKLTVNKKLNEFLQGDAPKLSTWQALLAGVGTGLVQVTITNPYELVKIRRQLQTERGKAPSSWSVIKSIVAERGPLGLYTGVSATLLRDIPFNALYFTSYNYLRSRYVDEDGHINDYVQLGVGCIAGCFAAFIDTPADNIKTRLQNGHGQYTGIADCVRKVYADKGPRGFLRGASARVLIIGPLFGITFYCFEKLQEIFFTDAPGAGPTSGGIVQSARTMIESAKAHISSEEKP